MLSASLNKTFPSFLYEACIWQALDHLSDTTLSKYNVMSALLKTFPFVWTTLQLVFSLRMGGVNGAFIHSDNFFTCNFVYIEITKKITSLLMLLNIKIHICTLTFCFEHILYTKKLAIVFMGAYLFI